MGKEREGKREKERREEIKAQTEEITEQVGRAPRGYNHSLSSEMTYK